MSKKNGRIPSPIIGMLALVLVYLMVASPGVSETGKELIWAAKEGRLEKVKRLLAEGADVNTRSRCAQTALMEAAEAGHLEVVKLLLDNGADINARNGFGWTVLMHAVFRNHLEVARLLLIKGADINAKEKDGKTALWMAAH